MLKKSDSQLEPKHIIAIVVFALAVFGLVILSSASAIIAHKNFGSNDFYFWKQFRHLIVGIVAWVVFYNIPYKLYEKIAPIIYGFSLFSLVLVFVPGIGAEYGTAHSWIDLPLLPSIQPAEYAKLGLIIYLSFLCKRKMDKIKDFTEGFIPIVLIVGIMLGLIVIQPDYGTSLIIALIAFSIVFVAGAAKSHLTGSFLLAICLAAIVASRKQYIYDRFTAFLDPFYDSLGRGYHIIQSLIAVGSGGFWGKGFGNSRQKFEYVPEAQGDSIFAIAGEELGFFRVVLIVLMFLILAYQGYRIARGVKDPFGKYLATGITSWIIFQAFINIMVVIALFPTTGIPLPFISYGGSSLLSSFIGIGILMNISNYNTENTSASGILKRKMIASNTGANMYRRKRWR
jgi:cell division protein FtsW